MLVKSSVANAREYKFNTAIQAFLLSKNVPPFRIYGRTAYFVNSKILRNTLSNAPMWVRALYNEEVKELVKQN